jgi:putative restriction endonuclease
VAYWWVNHKQTRRHEVRGGYLWSPLTNQNGRRNQTYDNMALASPGDIVFSYANGYIGAVGVVMERASPCPKPTEFGSVGDYWSNEGWLLPVAFRELDRPVHPREHLRLIAPLLPDRWSPIRPDGMGNQGVYLTAISIVLGDQLSALAGTTDYQLTIEDTGPTVDQLIDVTSLEVDRTLTATHRAQLVKARVGQGLFRARVLSQEPCCRVTGVTDHRLLRASHIKPWSRSNNSERLDANNGLMLSPHIDALFDQHLISFEDSGRLIVRPDLSSEVLSRWSIDRRTDVGAFRLQQQMFLEEHRRSLAQRRRDVGLIE